MNTAILIGNLVSDPQTITISSGKTKCTFRLATQRKHTNPQTGKREADFHNVVTWGSLADTCAKYLSKGRKCSVTGSIQYRSYDAQDGTKRYVTEIIASGVEFLSSRPREAGQDDPQDGFAEVDDDELPF